MNASGFFSDGQSIFWSAALILGVFFFIFGIVYIIRKKSIREEHFLKAGAFEFAASWIMFLPEEYFNNVPDSIPAIRITESIFTALLRAFNIYMGNGYSRVAYKSHPVFSGIYAILMTMANICLLLFVAGFILKFFDGPLQRIRLSLFQKRYTYIFSACNDKTVAIAESLINRKEKQKFNLIFAKSGGKPEADKKQAIDALHGMYMDMSIEEILAKIDDSAAGVEIFLFGDKEEDNLSELEGLYKGTETKKQNALRVFVEITDTPWSLYDGFVNEHDTAKGDDFLINFVRAEENFAFNNLYKTPLFDHYTVNPENDKKEIKALIVGMNVRSMEMLKAILHLGQMPGYRLTVMVMDESDGRDRLRKLCPEVYDECDKEGDAIYKLIYKENVDLHSASLYRIIEEEYAGLTFAFVNTGDDLLNADIAMNINALCVRKGRKDDYILQANISDQNLCKEWNPLLTGNIRFVGGMKDTYAYSHITMSDIEKASKRIHKTRNPGKTWTEYYNNEYNRHSVYARTLSLKHKVAVIHDLEDPDDKLPEPQKWDIYMVINSDPLWKMYEHMRWNMYTRATGYVLADDSLLEDAKPPKKGKTLRKETRVLAKVHNDLKDFSDLDEAEQKKDSINLQPDHVKILMGIEENDMGSDH